MSFKENLYLNFIKEDRYLYLIRGLGNTLLITIVAVVVGILLGFLLVFCLHMSGVHMTRQADGRPPILRHICTLPSSAELPWCFSS